jgi:hypothetical protein
VEVATARLKIEAQAECGSEQTVEIEHLRVTVCNRKRCARNQRAFSAQINCD